MKRIYFSFLLILFICSGLYAKSDISLQYYIGTTAVDICADRNFSREEGKDLSLYAYDIDNYKIILQMMTENEQFPQISTGYEVGFHRLYYWEQQLGDDEETAEFMAGSVWSTHGGLIGSFKLGNDAYIMTGINFHYILDGAGLMLGVPIAFRYEWYLWERWKVPVEIRGDWILSRDTLCGVTFGGGLKYEL
jgi:hypothetical protein